MLRRNPYTMTYSVKFWTDSPVTPRVLIDALSNPDRSAAKRAFEAMMGMKKIDVAAIESALRG